MKNKKSTILLGDKYLLFPKEKLGKGAFGEVFLGLDKQTNNYVAIKIENSKIDNQLIQEALILKYLQGCNGIPQYHSFIKNKNYNFLITDLLGPNLESLFEKMNNHFSIKTIIYLGIEMINIIEDIHKRHIIHRDIKPENFVISLNKNLKNNSIYLIDFGLSKRFLIYLYKGNLPWQDINNYKNKNEINDKILEKKINITIDSLCEGMPNEFNELLSYIRSLQFDEKPDYDMMRKKLIDLLNKEKISIFDINFDWNEKNLSNENLSTLDDDI